MNKIRKGDQVIINTGKDKGKTGTITQILDQEKVIVEGVNLAKKHAKPNPMRGEQGGIVSKEMPLNISNVAIFNATTNKADKVGFKLLDDGRKIRVYKSNGESIDA